MQWSRVCPVAALLLTLAVITAARRDTRAQLSPMPFIMGTRYGRSSELQSVAQRGDRFFMGSRYGKRAEGVEPPAMGAEPLVAGVAGDDPLLCEFTGVWGLYRCVAHETRDTDRRTTGDESDTEEEV